MRRTAFLLCGDWHWADDLTRTAFMRLAVSWRKVRDREALDGYVRTCLVRAYLADVRRVWRRRERSVAEPPDVTGGHGAAEGTPGRLAFTAALRRLPPRQRAVLICRYYQDLDVAATAAACTGGAEARHCTVDLVGSDDGGRTWTVRTKNSTGTWSAPAPGALLRMTETHNPDPHGPKLLYVPWVSRDGGRTWAQVRSGAGQLPEVPAGGWIQCAPPQTLDFHCELLGVDPVNARWTPLATQPDMDIEGPASVRASGGLWVTGRERGGEHRPAVAVSTDRGRTWSVHVFGLGALLLTGGARVVVAGPGAYLAYDDEALYRSTDGLHWTRTAIQPQR